MGLTFGSTGIKAVDNGFRIDKKSPKDRVIALAGNPNVGKSTVFNYLTGLNQHTGNWPGKTVSNAQGYCSFNGGGYVLVDLPGTYSILSNSTEEEIARDFICFGGSDAVIVVCDATCLERNLNLVLQVMEITENVVICINLMDEAKKKDIEIDIKRLSQILGVPVVGTSAAKGKGLDKLMHATERVCLSDNKPEILKVKYIKCIEEAIDILMPSVINKLGNEISPRWISLKLLENNQKLIKTLGEYFGTNISEDSDIAESLKAAQHHLESHSIHNEDFTDKVVSCIVMSAEAVCAQCVNFNNCNYNRKDRKIDRILTNKYTGIPIMIGLLCAVFWLTITGANYPSQLISSGLFRLEEKLVELFIMAGAPPWLYEMLILGMYRVLAWVVSVMLPPMAIFFPLFTLLEDLGYLPRVAFNLDSFFKKSGACGKQALTMAMGFGCNAAGVVGCRIIDSPRERLIAIITNNFVPCNGRFPTLIAIITMFFVFNVPVPLQSLVSSMLLMCVILLGIFMTFFISRLLSATILKGIPSSFTLEMPPFRKPQIGKIIIRSIFDRTLFVLGRAAAVAAPAGLFIWIIANITIGGSTILTYCTGFLDPFARMLGMDGVILMAFILGLPANEIVIPVIIMSYMASGKIMEPVSLVHLRDLLVSNGWTWVTAVSAMLFSLMHWPCSTTCLTIKKETGSLKWTLLSALIPTATGIVICFLFAQVAYLFV